MYTELNQAGTLGVTRGARSIRLGLIVGWLIVGLAVAGLIGGLLWSDNRLQYPGAEQRTATHFQFDGLPKGIISQHSVYQTADDLPQVLGWYAQHFGLGHDVPDGENCVTMTRVDGRLPLQQSLIVTLCSHSEPTLIFVNRSLGLDW